MIDNNIDRSVDGQFAANEYSCYVEAKKNGYDVQQADNCDAGDLECKNCPFQNKE